jgi:hypothetical protein
MVWVSLKKKALRNLCNGALRSEIDHRYTKAQ